MRLKELIFILLAMLCVACAPTDSELAEARLQQARELVNDGHFNQAKIEIDSIHLLYPKEVAVRRAAKSLNDSIVYLESQRTVAYTDSILPLLLEEADLLLRKFNYEKQTQYEDHGRYVHKLLNTDKNRARCFLQCYVTDARELSLKSYYFGGFAINQEKITLIAEAIGDATPVETSATGSNHSFEAEGIHEIMTFTEDDGIQLLRFISTYSNQRIRVRLVGKTNYDYYLQDNEKQALSATYELAVLMRDIRILEQNANLARAKIATYESKS